MNRFIFVTFIFLGWVFYVASGGADYAPRPGSLQARAVEEKPEPIRNVRDLLPAAEDAAAPQTVTSLADLDLSKALDTSVTLASVGAENRAIEEAGALVDIGIDLAKVATLSLNETDVNRITAAPRDIREVTGTVVNMRSGAGTGFDRVGKLTQGTEIEVLEDPGNGWVSILVPETGKTGWIADWLITAAN
jgi:uncharacterized protein YgiM (DUF1202 family)